jgi:hypothetical protein
MALIITCRDALPYHTILSSIHAAKGENPLNKVRKGFARPFRAVVHVIAIESRAGGGRHCLSLKFGPLDEMVGADSDLYALLP